MKYVSINSVPNGSTGAVMRQIADERRALGDECWLMWGRGRAAENDHEFNFGYWPGIYLDVAQTRLDGRAGFHSKRATKRLISKLESINPDVIHLHNIHGYCINVEMLFDWLTEHEEVEMKWTLHDCWAFTGHCAYFTFAKCEQWREIGGCTSRCPQLHTYPKTISKSSCAWNFEKKKECFTRIPEERMTIVTPSYWLADLVKESFLSRYPLEVRHNKVDACIFKPTQSSFRQRYGIGKKFMILGVASPWTERKGLHDFKGLARILPNDQYQVVLVGISKKQMKTMPKEIIALPRTESAEELAAIYTAADIFVHPGIEETYGLVVAEACACGTHVIVREGSACVEAADKELLNVYNGSISSICDKIIIMANQS